MNFYITYGTVDYLNKLQKQFPQECMLFLQNEHTAVLMHETMGESVFQQPKKYEVIDKSGSIVSKKGFAVLNHIPVTDEGRPLFEYSFKERARLIENQGGFVAIRVLKPLQSDTYIILTLWEDEKSFTNWKTSQSFAKAHQKNKHLGTDSAKKNIFPSPSYVKTYYVVTEEDET
ncbi:antibiotic biosynthesis monooxygenase family protein [Aeribacillus alveayuensis]|uniref:Heme-degrading monooxygenase HmoA n=1 Tax=Aeribacillus alveayuensis TaxID=279215 RepID=A0ABT9VN67_9BACI|nr:heme-degrading monooxygenase HmoA [Bacillus alveayuensis]